MEIFFYSSWKKLLLFPRHDPICVPDVSDLLSSALVSDLKIVTAFKILIEEKLEKINSFKLNNTGNKCIRM